MARPNAPATPSILQATTSFIANVGGQDMPVRLGDLADPESAVAKKYPTLFGPVAVRFAGPRIEQATAAPGEKRGA
jgi:hypothetical protein